MRKLLCISLLLFCKTAGAQEQEIDSSKIGLINSVVQFLRDSAGLELTDKFYSSGNISDDAYYYVYQSSSNELDKGDSISYRFFSDQFSAQKYNDSLAFSGYSTHLYKTAANSNARISKLMLGYPDESIVHCIIHEAFHHFVSTKCSPLKYSLNEALCEVMAVKLSANFYKDHPELNREALAFQSGSIENIYKIINMSVEELNDGMTPGERIFKTIDTSIKMIVVQHPFLNDRYNYKANFAYIKRVRFYSKNYFFLQTFARGNSTKDLMSNIRQVCTPEMRRVLENLSKIEFNKPEE